MRTGIGDIAVYIPKLIMSLSRLLQRHDLPYPNIKHILNRAIKKTGQISLRFPYLWEDAATMAGQAAMTLLSRMSHNSIASLRYIAVGTESATDMAKPIAAHVGGMLRAAGFPIPKAIATFQTQHACASGTYSLLGVNALLSLNPRSTDRGLVICTDIARYETGTSAEITQGAGAVAMIAEHGCGLVEIDTSIAGFSSNDVDDFFRPVGTETPQVRGAYSIQCYKNTIDDAFQDYCRRTRRSPSDVLQNTELFAFHTPYYRLPLEMIHFMAKKYLDISGTKLDQFLIERDFEASIKPAALVGNLYSGALFLSLASLLNRRYERHGKNMVGEKILLLSYGSGNTAVVLSGRVASKAPELIRNWDLNSTINYSQEAHADDYDNWVTGFPFKNSSNAEDPTKTSSLKTIPSNSFYLDHIREDGYRMYSLNR